MSKKRRKQYDKSVYNSFVLVMQFGINMLVPICMMSALGIFLDNKLGTSWMMILFFFIGAVAGGQNVYRMAKRIYATKNDVIAEKLAELHSAKKSATAEEKGRGDENQGSTEKNK